MGPILFSVFAGSLVRANLDLRSLAFQHYFEISTNFWPIELVNSNKGQQKHKLGIAAEVYVKYR